jgi:hypothetical protein
MDDTKSAVNACIWLYCSRAKIKALHPQQMQGKRKARSFLTGWSASYLDALNSAEKNQKKNRMQDNIICRTPSYHAKTLVCGLAAALCVYIRVQRLEQLAIQPDTLNVLIHHFASSCNNFRRSLHHGYNLIPQTVPHLLRLLCQPLIFAVFVALLLQVRHF